MKEYRDRSPSGVSTSSSMRCQLPPFASCHWHMATYSSNERTSFSVAPFSIAALTAATHLRTLFGTHRSRSDVKLIFIACPSAHFLFLSSLLITPRRRARRINSSAISRLQALSIPNSNPSSRRDFTFAPILDFIFSPPLSYTAADTLPSIPCTAGSTAT